MSLDKDTTPKQRRERITYTQSQLDLLEKVFDQSKYPDPPVCEWLINELGISDSRLQTWFRNKRAKWRQKIKAADPNSDIELYNSKARPKIKTVSSNCENLNLSTATESNSSEDSSNSQCLESLKNNSQCLESLKNNSQCLESLKNNSQCLESLENLKEQDDSLTFESPPATFIQFSNISCNQLSFSAEIKPDQNNNDFDYFYDLPPMFSPFSSVTEVKLDEEGNTKSNNNASSCQRLSHGLLPNQKREYFDNGNMKNDFHLLSSYYTDCDRIDMNYSL